MKKTKDGMFFLNPTELAALIQASMETATKVLHSPVFDPSDDALPFIVNRGHKLLYGVALYTKNELKTVSKSPYPVGPGWWPLLDEKLPEIRKTAPGADLLIKEKFGRCRVGFYLSDEDKDKLDKMIQLTSEIEELSATICENCGAHRTMTKLRPWCKRCDTSGLGELRMLRVQTEKRYFSSKASNEIEVTNNDYSK